MGGGLDAAASVLNFLFGQYGPGLIPRESRRSHSLWTNILIEAHILLIPLKISLSKLFRDFLDLSGAEDGRPVGCCAGDRNDGRRRLNGQSPTATAEPIDKGARQRADCLRSR